MYCPECGGEYRPGIEMCPTCEVKLTEVLALESASDRGPRLVPRLVDLVGFIDEQEARDARGRLKAAGIKCELVIREAVGTNGEGDVGDEFWIRVAGHVAEAAADALGLEPVLSENVCPSCGAPLQEDEDCQRCGRSTPRE